MKTIARSPPGCQPQGTRDPSGFRTGGFGTRLRLVPVYQFPYPQWSFAFKHADDHEAGTVRHGQRWCCGGLKGI